MPKYKRNPKSRVVFEMGFPADFRNGSIKIHNSISFDYFSSPTFRAIAQNGEAKVGFTGVGALIWMALENEQGPKEIAQLLTDIFKSTNANILQQDCESFLNDLLKFEMVQLV